MEPESPPFSAPIGRDDDLEQLLAVLPRDLLRPLAPPRRRDDLIEIVLDLGRRPEARFPDQVVDLSERLVTREDLAYVVDRLGQFGKDNRAGIERTLHRISAIRNRVGDVIGLTCRVGRAVFGTVDIVRDRIHDGASILLLGRPGVGKTTLLREAARVLADDLGKRVVVVDTSNEIAGDGDVPHPGIGRARRMQVPSPDQQHAVMIEAVENHMPEVIVIDEIGTGAEALAARTIAERGVQLIATAHGNTLENLLQNPTLADLVGGIHPVTLSDEEARRRGSQKTVLERKAPPTFDVVIEIRDKDVLAVHHDVAEIIDAFLRGAPIRPERRRRTAEGRVEIEQPPAAKERLPLRRGETHPPEIPRKVLRLFPFAISRGKLERAIRELRVPVTLVDQLGDADVILTVKGQVKRQPSRLKEAQRRGTRLEVVRSNTGHQLESFLRAEFSLPEFDDIRTVALREVEEAISLAAEQARPVELLPQDRFVRRLQHELIESYGYSSHSQGQEPYRRVVVQPR